VLVTGFVVTASAVALYRIGGSPRSSGLVLFVAAVSVGSSALTYPLIAADRRILETS